MPRKKSSHKTYEQSIAAVLALERGRGGNLIEILRSLATKIFGGPTAEGVSRDEILQYHLTPREREVAYLVALGFTNKEIGDALVIAPETVKTHVKNILSKMELNSKVELRLYLVQWHEPNEVRGTHPSTATPTR
jgi:DNA-binding NarL/FixJ family response regulator